MQQGAVSSRSYGKLKSTPPPLFIVELAYAADIDELATSSNNVQADPSELVVFHPSEDEFHTRLEVWSFSSTSSCSQRDAALVSKIGGFFTSIMLTVEQNKIKGDQNGFTGIWLFPRKS